jgi:hypothetical protein
MRRRKSSRVIGEQVVEVSAGSTLARWPVEVE